MFFARCIVFLVGLLPERGKVTWYVRLALDYYKCREKVIKWHRTRLEKLDPVFRLQQESMRLAFARARARERVRIHVLDSEHPLVTGFLGRSTK